MRCGIISCQALHIEFRGLLLVGSDIARWDTSSDTYIINIKLPKTNSVLIFGHPVVIRSVMKSFLSATQRLHVMFT
jgi:hypothetical protein